MCDTIGVLNKGHIIATGTPSEVRNAIAEKVNVTNYTLLGSGTATQIEGFGKISLINGVTTFEVKKESSETANVRLELEAIRISITTRSSRRSRL